MIAPLLLAAANPLATPPLPLPMESEARRVIEWQLASPPREGRGGGLSPDEAEVIHRRYLESIGETLKPAQEERRSAQQ